MHLPAIDPAAPLLFIVNAVSGREGAEAKRAAIEAALSAAGRSGELRFTLPAELAEAARRAAVQARERRSAVVAVGGDGTMNAVAQAAHAEGCAMGVVPQGTFNYFARAHGIPTDAVEAVRSLLRAMPVPVQVGCVNGHVFLVNASLGLYPELLQDREAYKARFGRSRLVAVGAGLMTLLRVHRQLRLRIERSGGWRDVRTPTLFIGNNRLQLERAGVAQVPALDAGCLAAVMLRPIGSGALLWLLLRGALGSLGEADDVESFGFRRMVVAPRFGVRGRMLKVAFDGEVSRLRAPLEFSVSPRPLFLLAPGAGPGVP